jgi:multicomponent Na+:H+ antiporter subunit F
MNAFTLCALILIGAALLAAGLACIRLLRGPAMADRVLALDVLLASALTLAIAAALLTRRSEFLDVAIGLALVGFIATLGWAQLIERTSSPEPTHEQAARHD